jgi:hypothetical protein
MLHPFDKLTVDTFAGPYVIELHYDLDAAAPDYTDDGGLVYLGDARTISARHGDASHIVDELLTAHSVHNDNLYDHEIRSGAAIARYLRLRYGLTGILEVARSGDRYRTATPSADRYRRIEGMAWAPADATAPEDYSRGTVATYDAWANSEVYGYIVTAPDSREVTSCWDFYADPDEPFTAQAPLGLAHMLDEARAAVAEDSAERIAQANTVGAGIIGLI